MNDQANDIRPGDLAPAMPMVQRLGRSRRSPTTVPSTRSRLNGPPRSPVSLFSAPVELSPSTMRYVHVPASGSATIARARARAGLTQDQLAQLAHTSQSAIAAYETGAREPSLPVLDRILRASGHVLRLTLEPDPQLFRLVELAEAIRATTDERRRLRMVFEFLRSAGEDGHPLLLLVAAEPDPTGEPRFDALLAAVAEDLCVHAHLAPPSWVSGNDRFLPGFWWVAALPSARACALVHAPASYRRRGVMLDRHDLGAA